VGKAWEKVLSRQNYGECEKMSSHVEAIIEDGTHDFRRGTWQGAQ
jgi:hypothetical protein